MAYSSDSKIVLTGGIDKLVRLWKVADPVLDDPARIMFWGRVLTAQKLDPGRDEVSPLADEDGNGHETTSTRPAGLDSRDPDRPSGDARSLHGSGTSFLEMERRSMWRFSPTWLLAPILALGASQAARPEVVTITILHLNDVYEIGPTGRGAVGGLARVATLIREAREEDPNVVSVLAGDFLSPSPMNREVVDGRPIDGRQLVDVLNAMGLDYATFGNHEFDLAESSFFDRVRQARFHWVASNVELSEGGKPAEGLDVSPRRLFVAKGGETGAEVRVGLLGLTYNLNHPRTRVKYADFTPTADAARRQVAELKDRDKADIIVAITHMDLDRESQAGPTNPADLDLRSATDIELAEQVEGIDLILGGHEHENVVRPSRSRVLPPIYKADANARTVYLHRIRFDTGTRKIVRIDSTLKPVTSEIAEDEVTASTVRAWIERADLGFRARGYRPDRVIGSVERPLDGREARVRNGPGPLTDLIARAMVDRAEALDPIEGVGRGRVDLALFNSGMIRIDDIIAPGPIREYDICRILPFGGDLWAVDLDGKTLLAILGKSQSKRGKGGYLQSANVSYPVEAGRRTPMIRGFPVEPDRIYRVCVNDYILNGGDGFDELKPAEPGKVGGRSGSERDRKIGEIQRVVIDYLDSSPR